MCDKVASFACEKLIPVLVEGVNVIRGVPREVANIKEELESIQAKINGADRMAAAADNTSEEIKRKVKHLRQISFRIEDVIEDYIVAEEQQPHDPGCAALPYKTIDFIKTMILRLRISYEIQDIKSLVQQVIPNQSSFEKGSSSCIGGSQENVTWHSLRMNAHYVEEADIVGFEKPKGELIGWLEETQTKRTVISVVGMGGQGKTTLARTVFKDRNVIRNFDCNAWITVSQSYTVEGLLRDMLKMFSNGDREGNSEMNRYALIDEVRSYLGEKRYVIFFDDVWKIDFWSEIEYALLDNKKGSRILITTRSQEVADFCKRSSFVHIQNLQPLTETKSWELFCKKAFLNEPDELCPKGLEDISTMFVEKCDGLPLAIIAIGGLLASKEKSSYEWQKLYENLISELERCPNSTGITNILGLSYDDLPTYLKPCFLYFGIYPEDYEVKSTRVIKQWIAEGFVKYERNKTLEEVAEQYLKELIHRRLVQVSSVSIDGKAKRCRVHDLFHEMILKKIEDLSFCYFVQDNQLVSSGMIRRLKIDANSNLMVTTIEASRVWSLYIFREEELTEDFVREIPAKYKLLKVLDFEHSPLSHVPENLGNLSRLRYLSFRKTGLESLPESIGNLQFLETLDLRQTRIRQMPREINKLRKLQHLLANYESWGFGHGIQMMEGFGGLESLQTLCQVELETETDYRGVELIKELAKLRQLRFLGMIHVKREYGSALCSSINEMQYLEKLYIDAHFDEAIDLHSISALPVLQKLRLQGKLERFPKWVLNLRNLVKLSLINSKLTDDPLESLKDMPNLLFLSLDKAFEGEILHFQDGGFKTLKKLSLRHLYSLNSICVDEGALPSLKELVLEYILKLIEVPHGIEHLGKLEVFHIINMPEEFRESIREKHQIIQHVRQVKITDYVNYWDKTRSSSDSRDRYRKSSFGKRY